MEENLVLSAELPRTIRIPVAEAHRDAVVIKRRAAAKPPRWYYCLGHRTVEREYDCPETDRFGPYPSRGEAVNSITGALQHGFVW
ncbi:hypothetical protein [Amycolatopsis anabasis]|uniref:hypothetical protein n=1 Tax=Amycolatopsis anabasis TaxID=1840409 RepID=UPI00131C590D|nr:hypothetical protein [Amycolatopsis anabasis]